MHEHWTVEDWTRAFEASDEGEHAIPVGCPDAAEAWADGTGPWMLHAADCAECRETVRAQELAPDEVLDCPDCREALDVVFDLVDEAEHFEPAVIWELQRAEERWAELAGLPQEDRVARVRSERRFHEWGFVQKLLRDARGAWHDDPRRARERALLAVVVAERLPPEPYHPQWVADLQAKAHAYLANAHRILADFAEAERDFGIAEERLRQGVGSIQAEAEVLSLKASLLIDQHRHREALAVLSHVERLFASVDDYHEIGRVALKRALVFKALGRPKDAAAECARAASDVDPSRDPLLVLLARQNSVGFLAAAGHVDEAREVFESLPPVSDRGLQIRRSWIEGNLLRAEERYGAAREAYERTRTAYAEMDLHYDAALVSLDLALAAFEEGHLGEVQHMAREASVLLTMAGAKQEAFAALQLLLLALRRRQVTRAILRTVRERVASLQPS